MPSLRCSTFNLADISLANNNLDDECCGMLACSFLGKKSIERIKLCKNDDITIHGLSKFASLLVGDKTVSSIEGSNHNVRIFKDMLLSRGLFPSTVQLFLVDLLNINSTLFSERKKIRSKIIYMLQCPRTLLDVISMDITLLPRVLKVS